MKSKVVMVTNGEMYYGYPVDHNHN